jgi:cation:H+ antiporter
MALSLMLLIVGFIFVIKGASYLIEGASALAKKLSVPEIVIALTVVSFGTSSPELAVNIFASIGGKSEIALGNIIGSNIFNILFILGISGLIRVLRVQKNTVWKEIPFSLLAAIVLFGLVNDHTIFGSKVDMLSLLDGLFLLALFIAFIIYIFWISKMRATDQYDVENLSAFRISFYIIIGFTGLFIGGKLVVDKAVDIARWLQVSEKLIAVTVVAAGTSLPELATSSVAAYKGKNDIAIGNIVGSNIFNIFFILGISAIIEPISYNRTFNFDLCVLIVATSILFFTMFTGKRRILDRWEAFMFLLLYLGYLVFIVISR